MKLKWETLPLNIRPEQAAVVWMSADSSCPLHHGSETRLRFRDDSSNPRATVAELPMEEFLVFLYRSKEWEAKAAFCKYSPAEYVCTGKWGISVTLSYLATGVCAASPCSLAARPSRSLCPRVFPTLALISLVVLSSLAPELADWILYCLI